jgi:SAM-dependent methyltransferase
VNFSSNTVWEGQIREDSAFRFYSGRFGRQFVADATALNCIASDSYEVLLSSNCLEHVANPLKALAEWRRVLRVGGVLVLVLPKREANFDHRRPITELSHLISDFDSGVDESDLTHISEILALHDLSRDSAAGNFEQFKARSLDNFNNRTLHHHVFDMRLVEAVVREAGFSVVFSAENEVDYFCLASKVV